MRTFSRKQPDMPQWVVSNDGVEVFTLNRDFIRYKKHDRHCDLYRESFREKDGTPGNYVSLSADTKWIFNDRAAQPLTGDELAELKDDIIAAYDAFGTKVKFQ